MKKIEVLSYGLMGLLLAGCQSEELFTEGLAGNGEGNVAFTVSAPEAMQATRAALGPNSNSALGGLTNVDYAEYDLRYQLAVYRVDGEGDAATYTQVVVPQKKIVKDGYEPVTYELRLTPNRKYRVVAWADFVREGQTEDLHYVTDDFKNIHLVDLPSQYVVNDESRDAYFGNTDVTIGDADAEAARLELKRPFAKLRVVTTDWNYGGLGEEMPDKVEVTYYDCKRFLGLNTLDGNVTSTDLAETDATVYTASLDKTEKAYAQGYDQSEHNRTIVVDYLMAEEEQTPVHMKMTAKNGETVISEQDLKTNIPIQRNWLTTVVGNVLTVGSRFEVSIDEGFVNEWIEGEEWWRPSGLEPVEPAYDAATNTYTIYTKQEFMWLPDHIEEMITAHGRFTLSINNDIDMSGVDWKPIYKGSEKPYVVKGNGHTLRNFSLNGKFGAVYVYEALGGIIKREYNAFTGVWGRFDGTMTDLTFENITINGLADASVHVDVDGNPVPHDKEAAYFAGCIGYVGQNWSTELNIENVHARHIQIKASDGEQDVQNIGGLIGWIGVGAGGNHLTNCSAQDIHITGYQAGGLVGQLVGAQNRGCRFINCWAEDVEIRMTGSSNVCGFIGRINDGRSSKLTNCVPPTRVTYLDDKTGEVKLKYDGTPYEPESPYYSYCGNKDGFVIEDTSTQP